jgi:hypothetical protein
LTTSPYARHVAGIIRDFDLLEISLRAFFKLHDEYRTYVLSRPNLYDQVQFFNVHPPPPGTPIEDEMGRFVEHVYEYNYTLHVDRIGSPQGDGGCLFVSYAGARRALTEFSRTWKPPREPRVYLVGHFLAGLFLLGGLLLILGWFMSLMVPGGFGVGPHVYAALG